MEGKGWGPAASHNQGRNWSLNQTLYSSDDLSDHPAKGSEEEDTGPHPDQY